MNRFNPIERVSRITFTVAAVLLVKALSLPVVATAQEYPPGINWLELNTPHFRLIFPEELTGEVQSVAEKLEAARESVSRTMDADPARIPVVLNNRSVESNGYVAFGPRRSVLESMPFLPGNQSFLGTGDWYTLLANHEYRHVAQLARMNRGLTRLGRIAFGEYGQASSINLAVPRWFLEGDAVGIESAYMESGRGRQPAFDMGYRGLLMGNQNYGYAKSMFRSYRDYVPGTYPYGYLITTHIRRKYGAQALSDIAARAGYWSVFPLVFPIAVKTSTGIGVQRLHREAMAELALLWSRQRQGLEYTPALRRNTETKKRWSNFAHPRYVSDRGLLVAFSDLRTTAELKLLERGDKAENLGDVDPAMYFHDFDANGQFAVWTQQRADPRFESLGYLVIMRRDLDSGKTRALTRRSRLFGPSISPDGRRIASVGFDIRRVSSIAVIDADDGTELYRVNDPDGRFISEVEWTRDGEAIIAVVQKDSRKSVVELDLATYAWSELLPPTKENVWSVADGDNYIYFVSDLSGIDNIYALDRRTGRRYQVTSRPLGAYFPDVSPDGSLIAYSDYTPDGFDVVEANLDVDAWTPVDSVEVRTSDYIEPLIEPDPVDYPIRSYRRVRDVLKFHSWLPTFDGRQAGLALSSTNLLNTTSATLVGLYDSREKTLVGAATAVISRWYPVLSLEAIYGGRTSTHTTPGNVLVYSWMETGGRLGVDFPFTFNRGIRKTSFSVGASGGWFHIDGRELVPFWHQGNGHLATMRATATFSNARASAHADFRPPRAQTLYVSLQQTTGRSDYQSKQAYAAASLTFGGFAKQHRFRFSGEAELERPENYRFSSNIRYSRGYPYRYADNIVRGSAAYVFPAGYPDLAIGNFLYVPRILGSVFYEHTWAGEAGSSFSTTGSFSSVGAELVAEFHVLSLPYPISVGARAVYRIEAKDYRVEPVIVLVNF